MTNIEGRVWLASDGREIGVKWWGSNKLIWTRVLATVKGAPGRRFDGEEKCWWLPVSGQSVTTIDCLEDRFRLDVAPAVKRVLGIEGNGQVGKIDLGGLVYLSEALDADLVTPASATGKTLYPFQRAGVAYALAAERCLIADPVGLGKTVQALTAVRMARALPLVVVVPASLRLNWWREIQEWLPGYEISVMESAEDLVGKAVTVVSYTLLPKVVDRLGRPAAVILDESTAVKSARAKRSRAAHKLAKNARFVLLLSATPVVNRSEELRMPLRIMGHLDAFGGWRGFEERYCRVKLIRLHGGRTVKKYEGVRNAKMLRSRLQSRCLVRRDKTAVLPQLPPVRRNQILMPITNRDEYRRAEREFVTWLREKVLADPEVEAKARQMAPAERDLFLADIVERRTARALRAEALTKLTALRQVAARGLLRGVMQFVEQMLEDGEKLLLYAYHREIQAELARAFPGCAQIVGGGGAKNDEAMQWFQTDNRCRLLVASLRAGGLGLTLTEAGHVAFAEPGWSPVDHEQAEGRSHGRLNDPHGISAWYLVAEGTIYESIYDLIESKREIVDAILDGTQPPEVDDIRFGVISTLMARGMEDQE